VDFAKLIDEITRDWEWLSFLARYCAGKNIGKAFCQDVKWWVLGAAALVGVLIAWWILGRLVRAGENWNHRRLLAKVADAETMKKHVWSGYTPDAKPSSEQRAERKSEI
jgi:hypothetical protein